MRLRFHFALVFYASPANFVPTLDWCWDRICVCSRPVNSHPQLCLSQKLFFYCTQFLPQPWKDCHTFQFKAKNSNYYTKEHRVCLWLCIHLKRNAGINPFAKGVVFLINLPCWKHIVTNNWNVILWRNAWKTITGQSPDNWSRSTVSSDIHEVTFLHSYVS